MGKIKNSTVLVTGGASGIGKLIARRCIEKGAKNLIIWDINPEALKAVTAELSGKGCMVQPYEVDVADLSDIEFAADDIKKTIGDVDILFNNAGIVVGKLFHEHSSRDIEKTIRINVLGAMHTTNAFLPDMVAQKRGHIVNISSAASFLANPKMSVYVASKWAVTGWSESLRLELEKIGGDLHVTTVCPSYINTGMFEGVTAPLLTPILEPEYIVNKILKGVENNSVFVREPLATRSIPVMKGLLPLRVFDFVADRIFGVYGTMGEFIGRPKEMAVPDKKKKITLS